MLVHGDPPGSARGVRRDDFHRHRDVMENLPVLMKGAGGFDGENSSAVTGS